MIGIGIRITVVLFIVFTSQQVIGQISPPGLGDGNTAGWMAFGIRQDLDSAKRIQSMTYVGFGRKSNPDNFNPYFKTAIFVVNQEFYHQFHKHWQYSGALSYRRQHEYLEDAPYGSSDPDLKQEFRLYGRLGYIVKQGKFKVVTAYRQEFRKFYTSDFKDWPESFMLRSRFRVQVQYTLNSQKTHRLIGSYEALFTWSKEENGWTSFSYSESRICLYYSISPKQSPFIYNIGYMNDMLGTSPVNSVSYLAFDVILEDPFKFLRRSKDKIPENLE